MSKRLILILALAFVLGISYAAYAEVQNVKVSGDLTISGVGRNNFDLTKKAGATGQVNTSSFQDEDSDILSIARVRVDADLTDNVSTTIRLLNERNWNGESRFAADNTLVTANRNIGLGTNTNTNNDENDIDLDLAYVTLKEFLYSPLSLTLGRQNLRFGNALVVGDPDTNVYSAATSLIEGDLSARKSFDALRATLDYNPLVVDLVYAKLSESTANLNDDVDLGGINASYELNKNTTVEGFFFSKVRGSNATPVVNLDRGNNTGFVGLKHKSDIVNTIGVRAVDKTLNNLALEGQVAYQFGRYNPKFDVNSRFDTTGSVEEGAVVGGRMHNRRAWAGQLKAAYDLKDIDLLSKYSPVASAGYTYLSGANRDQKLSERNYTGWDPMFEDQTEGHIMNAIFANTNAQRALLSVKAKVTDDISANVDYVAAWFAKKYPVGARAILSGIGGTTRALSGREFQLSNGKWIGQEIDATITYDYTEDVQFSLLGGIFLLGHNIQDIENSPPSKDHEANAVELIGSMKVTF